MAKTVLVVQPLNPFLLEKLMHSDFTIDLSSKYQKIKIKLVLFPSILYNEMLKGLERRIKKNTIQSSF